MTTAELAAHAWAMATREENPMPGTITGPLGFRYALTAHLRQRWAERIGLSGDELTHAVRFSRILATSRDGTGAARAALWYEPDAVLFIAVATRRSSTWVVLTAIPSWFLVGSKSRLVARFRKLVIPAEVAS